MKLVNFEPERDFDLLYDFFSDTENLSKISFPILIRNKQEFDAFLHNKLTTTWHDFKMMIHGDKPVGFFFTHNHSSNHCYVSLGVFNSCQSSGYGAMLAALALECIFMQYPYERVFQNVFGFNSASLNLHRKSGIVKEVGVLPRVRYYRGEYYDMSIFAVERDEFFSSSIASKFVR